MTHKDLALQYFNEHLHCSQAVLAAFASECGITEEQALRLVSVPECERAKCAEHVPEH